MKRLDIAIAGCGPGGMVAAILLHRAGHKVRLFDRFDQPRPVGSGLMVQPTGLSVLDAIGLGEPIRQFGAPIVGLHGLSMPSKRVALAMDYGALGPDIRSHGVHRSLLFDTLFAEAERSGIELQTGKTVRATEICSDSGRRFCFDDGSQSTRFDLVIDAMGSRSLLSQQAEDLAFGAIWITLNAVQGAGSLPDHLDQRYSLARQMAGILPIGQAGPRGADSVAYFWSLRKDEHPRWQEQGLDAWRDGAIRLWPESEALLAQITNIEQFIFATYQHRTLRRPAEAGLVHIGDAWHATSPQLGQGANMALLDAAALAWSICKKDDLPAALDHYVRARRSHVRLYQAMSHFFTPVFQSDSRMLPWLRDHLMGPMNRIGTTRILAASLVAGSALNPIPAAVLPWLKDISSQPGSQVV